MQRYEIPTHLDVEDRLFAGLTPRQLLLLIMGLGLGYSVWQRLHHMLPLLLVLTLAALPGVMSLALATLRPDGRPLEQWLLAILRYFSVPKVCLLERIGQGGQDQPLSTQDLAALEGEWAALRQATRAPGARQTDEWGLGVAPKAMESNAETSDRDGGGHRLDRRRMAEMEVRDVAER